MAPGERRISAPFQLQDPIEKREDINLKQLFAAIVSVGLLVSVCYGAEKLEIKDQKDKESDSLGYQFGTALKMQGVDIDFDVYTSAIRDTLQGNKPQTSAEEMQTIVMSIRQRTVTVHIISLSKCLKFRGTEL